MAPESTSSTDGEGVDGGEANQTNFSNTVYTGDLGIYQEWLFGHDSASCAAIGNPVGCGLMATDDNVAPDFLCCDKNGGSTITLAGDHESQAKQIVQTLNDAYGENDIYWEKSGDETLQRIVCGNLYPWESWSEGDQERPERGALTCIGSMSGKGSNPWMIGGPIGDSGYGWQPSGGFMWETYYVDVNFHNKSTLYFNMSSSGGTKSHPNQFVLGIREGKGATGIQSLSFEQTEYSITANQPWGGLQQSMETGIQLIVTITAGRHLSSGPAGFFNTETAEGAVLPTAVNLDKSPTGLNFASCGTLTATFTDGSSSSDPFCIGQGHTENPTAYVQVGEAGNNWWAGGAGWTMDECLRSPSGKLLISPARDVQESTTRNETLYVMPPSNVGEWEDPEVKGMQPLC
jgi:hypothetical protein